MFTLVLFNINLATIFYHFKLKRKKTKRKEILNYTNFVLWLSCQSSWRRKGFLKASKKSNVLQILWKRTTDSNIDFDIKVFFCSLCNSLSFRILWMELQQGVSLSKWWSMWPTRWTLYLPSRMDGNILSAA